MSGFRQALSANDRCLHAGPVAIRDEASTCPVFDKFCPVYHTPIQGMPVGGRLLIVDYSTAAELPINKPTVPATMAPNGPPSARSGLVNHNASQS